MTFRLITVAIALLLLPTQAEAQSCPCGSYRVRVARDWPWDQYERRCYRCPRYEESTRVYGYERRSDEERWERRDPSREVGISCKGTMVRVVGQSELSEKGAMNAAVRQWQSTVSYDYGEKFMNVENARAYRWRCDRASTNESFIGKLAEGASGGDSGFRRRCVVIAEPCMQPTKAGDKDER